MDSITDILSQGRDAQAQASKIYGVVVGLVTNNQDPEKLGRVKVKFPWLADTVESFWCRLAYPMNGKERGFWWIPEIDDEVLIAFEHGDPNRPYLLGGLYNGVDKPPKAHDITSTFAGSYYGPNQAYSTSGRDFNENGQNDLRFIRSRSGHLFIFDDKADDERITLCDKTGAHRLEIRSHDKRVVITSAATDGDIEIIADRKVWIKCKQLYTQSEEETKMKAGKLFEVKAGLNLEHYTDKSMVRDAAQNIDEKAGQAINYKSGTGFSQEAGTSMSIKSGTTMSVKAGATAEVVATATMTVKGAIVNIN